MLIIKLLMLNSFVVKKKALFDVAPICSLHEKAIILSIDLKAIYKEEKNNLISENLKRLRLLHNISQQELADCIGTTKSHISKYECGRLFPTKEFSLKLSAFFKLDMKYFYDEYLTAMDTFHDDLIKTITISGLSKNKFSKQFDISKRYICRHELPSRKNYLKLLTTINKNI